MKTYLVLEKDDDKTRIHLKSNQSNLADVIQSGCKQHSPTE